MTEGRDARRRKVRTTNEVERTLETADERAGGAPMTDGPLSDEDAIRRRAYELYLARGDTGGSETEDWLAAERAVRAERTQVPSLPAPALGTPELRS